MVDVDVTGGLRNTSTLLTLTMQVLEMASLTKTDTPGPRLGCVVYSDFIHHEIRPQNETLGLTDLVNAVSSFLRDGRADALLEYFNASSATKTSQELENFCKAARAFSYDLSLCRVDELPARVDEVNATLKLALKEGKKKRDAYDYLTGCISKLEELCPDPTRRVQDDIFFKTFGMDKPKGNNQAKVARSFRRALENKGVTLMLHAT